MEVDYSYLFRILLIGDSSVGKSCLFLRFSDDVFSETFSSTIGVDFKIRTLEIDGETVKLQIWDTAGQERFRAITLRKADGIFIVFDLTNFQSFRSIESWVESITQYSDPTVKKVLIGNKADLVDRRQVDREQAQNFADKLNMVYLETSAKTAQNVEHCFNSLAKALKNERRPTTIQRQPVTTKNLNSGCCK